MNFFTFPEVKVIVASQHCIYYESNIKQNMESTSIIPFIHNSSKGYRQTVKEDQFMYKNQQMLTNLNKKIDKRLDIGYYCFGPKSRDLIYPPRKYSPSRSISPKRGHPIKKKLKPRNKLQMIDQQQNTSGQYVLKHPDPLVADYQVQWTYEEPMLDKSIQQQIQNTNEQIQYTLQSEIIECQDASIQYSFEEPIDSVKSVRSFIPQYSQKGVQLDIPKYAETQIQYDEPKPKMKQKQLQIDIPDKVQLDKITKMNNQITSLTLNQKRQLQKNKKAKQHIQILKLKEQMLKLQQQIQKTEEKEKIFQLKHQHQLKLKQHQQNYQKQKKSLEKKYQYKNDCDIKQFISKIKNMNERPKIISNYEQEKRRKFEEEKKNQLANQQELLCYRKDVQNLTQQLKSHIFKRLSYQNQSLEQESDKDNISTKNASLIRKNKLSLSQRATSMHQLFPNLCSVKKHFVGSIVKNQCQNPQKLQPKQQRNNQHLSSARMTKAFWRQKSTFSYKFNNNYEERNQRKYQYLNKIHQKINHSHIISEQKDSHLYKDTDTSKLSRMLKYGQQSNNLRYTKTDSYNLSYKKLLVIKQKIDSFFANQLYFRYLYGQTNKIVAGYQLFSIFDIGLVQKNSIQIYKRPQYFVFSYSKIKQTHFIVIYHDQKSILYSKFSNHLKQAKNLEYIYSSPRHFKNFWAYQYTSSEQIYMGTLKQDKKQGNGIYINKDTYYQGQFKNNMKQGKGIMVLSNGDMYKGEFSQNLFHGEGLYHWANGQKYNGFFKHGLKAGFGKQNLINGDTYEGFYENNRKNGKGKYTWCDGQFYQGQFINDLKQGEGYFTNPEGSLIIGNWQKDSFDRKWNNKSSQKIIKNELPLVQKKRVKFAL